MRVPARSLQFPILGDYNDTGVYYLLNQSSRSGHDRSVTSGTFQVTESIGILFGLNDIIAE
eukprot:scaffold150793_cov37-Attheya_sp.AAC.1